MNSPNENLAVKFLPSLTDFVFLAVLLHLFGFLPGVPMLLSDGDTGWHIRTGQWILENGRIPDRDMFSFTKAGQPWFAWEWLWDVMFAWLHQNLGMAAVLLVTVLLLCLTAVLLFRLVRRKCSNVFLALFVTLLAMAASSVHWLARPFVVTPLLAVVFYSILERAREGKPRFLILLPMLMVLWTNLHGGFGVGLVLVGTYAAGELLAALVEAESLARWSALGRSRPYLLTLAGCLVATLLNPYGYRLHAHVYSYLLDPFYRRYVEEFKSISFQHPGAIFFEVLILLGAVAAYRCLSRKQFVYVLLFVGWCHLALVAVRNIPIFAVVTAPLAAQAVDELLAALKRAPVSRWICRAAITFEQEAAEFGETDQIGRFHVTSALALLVVGALLFAPSPPGKFRPQFNSARFPASAVQALGSPSPGGRVFTTDSWGGYLIYLFYPTGRVFIDGRSDFYGPEFCGTYMDMMGAKYDWQQKLDSYGIDTILLPVDAPLVGSLKESGMWRAVYDDKFAVVFRKAGLPR